LYTSTKTMFWKTTYVYAYDHPLLTFLMNGLVGNSRFINIYLTNASKE